MSLLHPAILLGLAFVAAPVLLHLLLRQKPKKLIFPAMRLIQHRRKQNSRRLRLRHVWLLLLRMLAIALLVLAITRPSLPAANYGLNLRELLTLVAVIAAGIGVYFSILSRWRKTYPRYEVVSRRASLRGWATGATLLALLLLVGWPYQRRVAAEITAPPRAGQIDIPVAAVFVFDTSLSMGYQQEGKTRLDVTRQVASDHLQSLPAGSRVAVTDTASDHPIIFQSTLGAAHARIEAIELRPIRLSLNDRLRNALLVQEDDRREKFSEQDDVAAESRRDRYVRRVYIFTDLARSAWRLGTSLTLPKEIERLKHVQVYLVDVGDAKPRNVAVQEISLSRNRIPRGGSLVVRATLASVGFPASERSVELLLKDAAGRTAVHGRRPVTLEPGTPQQIEFGMLTGLTGPVVQGEVRLVSSDPLSSDDVRYFTVEIGPPPQVLVVAPDREQAKAWMYTLNPDQETRFAVKFVAASRFSATDLAGYDVVCLVNVQKLTDEEWRRLGQYVDGGGGLAVCLGQGDEISPVSYNRGQAQTFLPAELDAYSVRGDWRLSFDSLNHPALAKVRGTEPDGSVAILENEASIHRFWKVKPAEGAAVLATYTDDDRSPAVVARAHGKGRVLMYTTDVDQKSPRRRWNTLPILVNGWAYLAFAHSMVEYLARVSDRNYTFEAGETAVFEAPAADREQQLLLRKPDLTQSRRTLPSGATQVVLSDTNVVGHYELATSGSAAPLAGCSVNAPADESDLSRLSTSDLDDLLGKDRYQVARDIDELEADINIADLGKEIYPVLMLLLIVAFCGEHLVANRFYEADTDAGAAGGENGDAAMRPPTAPVREMGAATAAVGSGTS